MSNTSLRFTFEKPPEVSDGAEQLNKENEADTFDSRHTYPILSNDNVLRRKRGSRKVTPSLCLGNHQQFVVNPGRAGIHKEAPPGNRATHPE